MQSPIAVPFDRSRQSEHSSHAQPICSTPSMMRRACMNIVQLRFVHLRKRPHHGSCRNSDRGQTNVPSPTRLFSMPTSSIAFIASRSDVRAIPNCWQRSRSAGSISAFHVPLTTLAISCSKAAVVRGRSLNWPYAPWRDVSKYSPRLLSDYTTTQIHKKNI